MRLSYSFPLWIAAFILIIAAVIIAIAYRRTDKPLTRRFRAMLISLRVAAIFLVLLCLLEPTIISRGMADRRTNLIFLVDDSQSMSLSDPGDNTKRIDAVKEAFSVKENSFLNKLDKKFHTIFYQFDSDSKSVKELNLTAQGTLTDIGKAISRASDEWRGQPISGMVLVSDGGNNSGGNPVDIARQSGIPIYTVGVGSPQMPQDIKISMVDASPIAYTDHILPVKAVIKSSGYDGHEAKVSLLSGGMVFDSVSLKLDSQQSEQIVNLQFKPQREGTFNFMVSIPPAPGEVNTKNNDFPFIVKVIKTKLKVLYVDIPRWELTFFKRALQRDPNIDATYLTFKKNPKIEEGPVTKFPNARNELFSYDVLIIGDITPKFFNSDQLNLIKDFAENKGGSIIFLGGNNSLGRGGFGESPLRDILPIYIATGGAQQVIGAFNPVLTPEGMRHPLTRLSVDEAENTTIWRDMASLTHFYAGSGVKMGAIVLAEHQRERGQPVIVLQRYGKGMVMLIASDSIWRWAFGGYPFGNDDSNYRRFWSGAIRWFASIGTEANLVNVETDKGSYYRDEKVQIKAYVYDENYMPLDNVELKMEIQIQGDETQTPGLTFSGLNPEGGGRYSTEFIPNRDGHYKIVLDGVYSGRSLGKGFAEFIVQPTVLEFQDTQLNEEILKNISGISGGAYITLKDISNLPSLIKEVFYEPYSFISERNIWDNAIVLIIALTILTSEWLLRKKRGLV